ncbi:hypothetical protein [Phenylobacterium sp.]|uniref:hypothetical protein n=1 Tax=Phenylobacterium sp. TaxID=1871053 RepID=UPI00374C9DD4
MTGFKMYFEWPDGGPVGDLSPRMLNGDLLDMARMEAAVIYAGASFHRTPPDAYRIEGPGGMVLYRFPERAWATR